MASLKQILDNHQDQLTARLEQIEKLEKLVVDLVQRVDVLEGYAPNNVEREMWDRRGEMRVQAVRAYRRRTGRSVEDTVAAFERGGVTQ